MKMRLQFSCKDLKLQGGDFDPMVVLFKCEKNFSSPKEVFKTEAVADDANPQFASRHTFDFNFEEMTYF